MWAKAGGSGLVADTIPISAFPQLSLRPGQLSQGETLATCRHLLSQPVVGEGPLGILC